MISGCTSYQCYEYHVVALYFIRDSLFAAYAYSAMRCVCNLRTNLYQCLCMYGPVRKVVTLIGFLLYPMCGRNFADFIFFCSLRSLHFFRAKTVFTLSNFFFILNFFHRIFHRNLISAIQALVL